MNKAKTKIFYSNFVPHIANYSTLTYWSTKFVSWKQKYLRILSFFISNLKFFFPVYIYMALF